MTGKLASDLCRQDVVWLKLILWKSDCISREVLFYHLFLCICLCPVYGFTETSLALRESSNSYNVLVEITKGSIEGRVLEYTVRVSPESTAGQGAYLDGEENKY